MSTCALPLGDFQFDTKFARPYRLKRAITEAARHFEDECRMEDLRRGRPSFRRLFVTLTYAENTKGNPNDIKDFMRHVRQWGHRCDELIRTAWVGEVQKRGALHYHLLIWLPKHLHLPKLDQRGWWRHGMTKIETARNAVGYLVKYASKCGPDDLRKLRKGMRLYGIGGGWPEWKHKLRRQLMPWWMRKRIKRAEDDYWRAMMREREADLESEMQCLLRTEREEHRRWRMTAGELLLEEAREQQAYALELWEASPQGEAARLARELADDVAAERRQTLMHRGRSLLARCKGGYCDRVTGELVETPYRVTVELGVVVVRRKETVQ